MPGSDSHLHSFRKLTQAFGHRSVKRSTTRSPRLVSSNTAIASCTLELDWHDWLCLGQDLTLSVHQSTKQCQSL